MNNGSAGNAATIPVSGLFTDGTQLQDAISGATYTVERRQRADYSRRRPASCCCLRR